MKNDNTQTKGLVLHFQRYSVHDGAGIRTLVFLKGCPLRCRWCSNPESQKKGAELGFNPSKCLLPKNCGMCVDACPEHALNIDRRDPQVRVDSGRCTLCFQCAEACPPEALIVYGVEHSVNEVLAIVEKDDLFYTRSGGGMTLSGGEPMFQAAFANALLAEARRRRIDTSMETCGFCNWEDLSVACRYLNAIIFDIKTMDPEKHKRFTGRSNEIILQNLANIRRNFPDLPILARTPVIPGVNDSKQEISAIVAFLQTIARVRYELLPYHRLGTPKYAYLQRRYPMGDVILEDAKFKELETIATESGIGIGSSGNPASAGPPAD